MALCDVVWDMTLVPPPLWCGDGTKQEAEGVQEISICWDYHQLLGCQLAKTTLAMGAPVTALGLAPSNREPKTSR